MEPDADDDQDSECDVEVFECLVEGMAEDGVGLEGDGHHCYGCLKELVGVRKMGGRTYDEAVHDHLAVLDSCCDCGPSFGRNSCYHPGNGVGESLEDDNAAKPSVEQVKSIE